MSRIASANKVCFFFQSFHRPYWQNLSVNQCYEGKADEGEKLHHKPMIEYVGSILAEEAAKIADEYNREDHYYAHSAEVEAALAGEFAPLRSLYEHKIQGRARLDARRVALVYDEAMMKHANVEDDEHPERPQRIERIFQTHVEFGLVDRWKEVMLVKSRMATQEEVTLVR